MVIIRGKFHFSVFVKYSKAREITQILTNTRDIYP
jgi:hypothetical protein